MFNVWGGVNKRETQIDIKNIKNNKTITLTRGGVVSQLGGSLHPLRFEGVKISALSKHQ